MADLSKIDLSKVPAESWTEAHHDETDRRLKAYKARVEERMKLGNWHRDEDDFVIDSTTGEIIGPHPDGGEFWGEIDMKDARPFGEVFPELAASIRREGIAGAGPIENFPELVELRRLGGRPKLDNPKKLVSIRLDADLVDRLKADGSGWQTRANELLRKAVGI